MTQKAATIFMSIASIIAFGVLIAASVFETYLPALERLREEFDKL